MVKSARGSKEFTVRKCLITVDYQVDFVNGSLGFDGAEKLENAIAEKLKNTGKRVQTLYSLSIPINAIT